MSNLIYSGPVTESTNYISSGIIPNGIRSYSTISTNQSHNSARLYNSLYSNRDILNKDEKLDPWFVTGFSDGGAKHSPSTFSFNIIKSTSSPLGYKIQLLFRIGLHSKDLPLHIPLRGIRKNSKFFPTQRSNL